MAFRATGAALVSAASGNRRVQLVERLSEKPDEELATLNMRHEDIVPRVFHDYLNV